MTIEAEVLASILPGADERAMVEKESRSLEEAATSSLQTAGIDGIATVQGSMAKQTWISGAADIDCFLLLSPDISEDKFEDIVTAVGEDVLRTHRKKYSQHPYIIGERNNFTVDLVPAYRIAEGSPPKSSVDRTPLHTKWVNDKLDSQAKEQVLLTKQWCKGVGAYGAETRIGGFSGYLLEILVHQLKGFAGFVAWAAQDCQPRHIAFGEDSGIDEVSPLVVLDPVDSGRNCAAAVTEATIELVKEAASAYQAKPDLHFFMPEPAVPEPETALANHLGKNNQVWAGLQLTPQTDRLDMVFPQFQRSARIVSEALERSGFKVIATQVDAWSDDQKVGVQWLMSADELPPQRIHRGPPADKEPNASKFRKKWGNHVDKDGEITASPDGRLQVTLRTQATDALGWLAQNLASTLTGKHVLASEGTDQLITSPSAAEDPWQPMISDFILDRRPWQRR